MKSIVVVLVCLLANACVDPPAPAQEVVGIISVDTNGCPQMTAPVAIDRNDKARWSLDPASAERAKAASFAISFQDYNPTYCVNTTTAKAEQSISCTARVNALRAPTCYLVTVHHADESSCNATFVLHIGEVVAHSCSAATRYDA